MVIRNNSYIIRFFLTYLVILFFSKSVRSQEDSIKKNLIESVVKKIKKEYVSKIIADVLADSITYKFYTRGYKTELNMDEFTFEITKDIRQISKDWHFLVTPPHYDISLTDSIFTMSLAKQYPKNYKNYLKEINGSTVSFSKIMAKRTAYDMFSFGNIEILQGNIGYVQIFDFNSSSYFKEENLNRVPLKKVFEYLKNTKSIIFDFRENLGGSTKQARYFCSFFSPKKNNYFITTESIIRYDSNGISKEKSFVNRYFTDDKISNKLTSGKLIYFLTSNRTFSAAELVVYKLKNTFPNVVVIGEQTRGGGNGHYDIQTEKYFAAIIPSERSYDESNADLNLEGVGIYPDIYCPSDSAFYIAYQLAKKRINVSNYEIKKPLRKIEDNLRKSFNEVEILDYIGNYRKIKIYFYNGDIYMIYDTFIKDTLVSLAIDTFKSEEFDSIKFIRNNVNSVVEINITHKDGYIEKYRKE
jgi:Peptidase family S41